MAGAGSAALWKSSDSPLGCGGRKIADRNLQDARNAIQQSDGWVAHATLQAAHVGAFYLSVSSQRFLRNALFNAKPPDVKAHLLADIHPQMQARCRL